MSFLTNIFKSFADVKVQSWAFMIGLVAFAFLLSRVLRFNKKFDTRKLTYGSVCITLSFILSYIQLYHWPQGGSITPGSMLPLLFFAFVFGPVEGILAGMVYGILQFIQDPYIVHWFQVILDYPAAFGALGLAGYFKKYFSLGVLAGGMGRFFFHFLSGVFFFASYAEEAGMNPILYSLMINGILIGTETLICFVLSLVPQLKKAMLRIKYQEI